MDDCMTRHPLFGIGLAVFGTLVLTPDTMFMRWSGMGGFEMIAWRGLLMGTAMLTAWAVLSRDRRGDLRVLASLILGEPTRVATWITILAVMTGIGIAVLSGDKGEVGLNAASLLGALFGLGTAIVLALNFVVIRRRPQLPILLVIGTGAVLAGLSGLAVAGPG